jgi:flavin reductase (NADH)/flavin reductase
MEMSVQEISDLHADGFRAAMRFLASGVSLITTRRPDGVAQGMLATAVSSVTADPPTILICVNRSATMHDDLVASGNVCVNLLGQQHLALSKRFSSSEARESRFEVGNWTRLRTDAPVLENALSALDCSVDKTIDAGSHTIILGKVLAVRVDPSAADEPLVYYDRQYGRWASL